jgi:nucleoside-diphosphate-sugar epimerase
MRVLVTGNRGYIGSVLAPTVAAAGHDVVGLDTGYYEDCDFGEPPDDFPTLEIDVRDVSAADLDGFDAVVHLAALSNDPIGDLNEQWTYDINLDGTLHLARMAKEAGVGRFVFASSCSMYGASNSDELLDESSPFNPLTAYAESKVRAEEGLAQLADDVFAPVSMRNATVYGVSPRLRLDIVLNNLAGWAHTTGAIRLLSDGSSWRPLLHVRDLSKVAVVMLETPPDVVRGQAFNVGSNDQNYIVRELAEILAEVTGCGVEFAGDASPDPRSYRVDFSRLASTFPDVQLDWNARRGAQELIDAYRSVSLTKELFEGRRYVRLRQLKHLMKSGALGDELRWNTPSAPTPDRSAPLQ